MDIISTATPEQVTEWILTKGYVVSPYPRKGVIVVNGYKRYSADKETFQAVKLAYKKKLARYYEILKRYDAR